jgi:hypothetical protein
MLVEAKNSQVIDWLLGGDPSIRWQVLRDLLGVNSNKYNRERRKIELEGWGQKLLSFQMKNGLWANALYSPKWISTTYTLLLLKRMGLPQKNKQAKMACKLLLDKGFYIDDGINYFSSFEHSETCVTGMVLGILSYFQYKDLRVKRLADHLLNQQMPDGGWNCRSFLGDSHSSFHTTINVLEGLREFEILNIKPNKILINAQKKAKEFLLCHHLYKSDTTGKVFDPKMTRLSFPPRWHYDILRALDYFQESESPYDERMIDSIEILKKKQTKDGMWKLQQRYSGKTYFEMEEIGKPSRWNTFRVLRVLNKYN